MRFSIKHKIFFVSAMSAALLAGCDNESSGSSSEDKLPEVNELCGNGEIDENEECDGSNLNDDTCQSDSRYITGTLSCNKSCKFNKSGCLECTDDNLSKCAEHQICSGGKCVDENHVQTCGDPIIEGDEECEGDNLNGKSSCADLDGFVAGVLSCNRSCKYDTSACVECTEENLTQCAEHQICVSGKCEFEEHSETCGNGGIDANEDCDGDNLNGKSSCAELAGFVAGVLSCSDCHYVTTQCVKCTDTDFSLCADDEVCEAGQCKKYTPEPCTGTDCPGTEHPTQSCPDGQEWSKRYGVCGYPVSSKEEFIGYKTIMEKYSQNANFLIKADIDFGEIKGDNLNIGESFLGKLYTSVIYGNDKKIKATFTNSKGLFAEIKDSTIQDLVFEFNGTNTYNTISKTVSGSTLKNLTIEGSLSYDGSEGESGFYNAPIFRGLSMSSLEHITANLELSHVDHCNFAGFAHSAADVYANDITINGSLYVDKISTGTIVYKSAFLGMIRRSNLSVTGPEPGIYNLKFNMPISTNKGMNVMTVEMEGNVKFDNVSVISAVTARCPSDPDASCAQGLDFKMFGSSVNSLTLSNFEDSITVSDKRFRYTFGGDALNGQAKALNIYNSIINAKYNYSFPTAPFTMTNVLYRNADRPEKILGTVTELYFKNDDGVTAEKMNQNLRDKKGNIPSGTYLPWYKGNDNKLHLNFRAKDAQMIVVP